MKQRYCKECGAKLIQTYIGAEEVIEYWGNDSSHPYRKYDKDTGKRLMGIRFRCPKERWYNSHDNYTKIKDKI